ncbi:MAG: aldo/keto reductase [Vicinamibacterales bacterium]
MALGSAAIGNLYEEVEEGTVVETVRAAWLGGVRYLDTAPHYGLGLAERRLGHAIRTLQIPREQIVISTKVGRLLAPLPTVEGWDMDAGFAVPRTHQRVWDFSARGVMRSLDDSCDRIGTDRVEIALLHDPDDHMEQAITEAFPALKSLRSHGQVAAIGAGMNNAPALARLVAECDLDIVMIAGRYSLLDQSALDELLPIALDRGTAVVVAGVFNSGVLAQASPDGQSTYDYTAAPREVVDRARRISDVCADFDVSLAQAAVQFPLGHPAVVSIAIGPRSAAEARADIGWSSESVPLELWGALQDKGLLRRDAPIPLGPQSVVPSRASEQRPLA